jgi:hypothetical protein
VVWMLQMALGIVVIVYAGGKVLLVIGMHK